MADNKHLVSAGKILRGLSDLRDQKLLCDVDIVAEDETFPVHRVVLAAASPYFEAMFTGGFKESRQSTVTLKEVSSKGLKYVLDTIYTSEANLTDEIVLHVLPVAKLMQMDDIVQVCEEFMITNISENTCLKFLNICEKYELEKGVSIANEYLLEYFEPFAATPDFCELSEERLCTYISDDRLRLLNGEIEVFRAAAKWIDHNFNRPDLSVIDILRNVRFPYVHPELLLDEVQPHQLLVRNAECRGLVSEALKFHYNIFTQPLQTGQQYKPRGEEKLIIIPSTKQTFGGQTDNDIGASETTIHVLKMEEGKMFQKDATKTLPMSFVGGSLAVVEHNNFLFLFGVDKKSLSSVALRYNPSLDQWVDLKPPPQPATIKSAVAGSGDYIYFFGGTFILRTGSYGSFQQNVQQNVQQNSKSAWKYSILTNTWNKLQSMPRALRFARAAAHGDIIYVAGDTRTFSTLTPEGYMNANDESTLMYAFDTRANLWLRKANMNQRRLTFSLERLGSLLYVCGDDGISEYYNTANDQWIQLTDVNITNGFDASSFVMGKTLYFVGGADKHMRVEGSDVITCLDYYDGRPYRASLPFKCRYSVCALLTVMRT